MKNRVNVRKKTTIKEAYEFNYRSMNRHRHILHSIAYGMMYSTQQEFYFWIRWKFFGFCHYITSKNHIQSFIYGWIDFLLSISFLSLCLSWIVCLFYLLYLFCLLSRRYSMVYSTNIVAGWFFSILWPSNAAIKIVFPVEIDFINGHSVHSDLWYMKYANLIF